MAMHSCYAVTVTVYLRYSYTQTQKFVAEISCQDGTLECTARFMHVTAKKTTHYYRKMTKKKDEGYPTSVALLLQQTILLRKCAIHCVMY